MDWQAELIIGMVLGFYVSSHRIRHVINLVLLLGFKLAAWSLEKMRIIEVVVDKVKITPMKQTSTSKSVWKDIWRRPAVKETEQVTKEEFTKWTAENRKQNERVR